MHSVSRVQFFVLCVGCFHCLQQPLITFQINTAGFQTGIFFSKQKSISVALFFFSNQSNNEFCNFHITIQVMISRQQQVHGPAARLALLRPSTQWSKLPVSVRVPMKMDMFYVLYCVHIHVCTVYAYIQVANHEDFPVKHDWHWRCRDSNTWPHRSPTTHLSWGKILSACLDWGLAAQIIHGERIQPTVADPRIYQHSFRKVLSLQPSTNSPTSQ